MSLKVPRVGFKEDGVVVEESSLIFDDGAGVAPAFPTPLLSRTRIVLPVVLEVVGFFCANTTTMTQGKSQTILAGNFIVCVMMEVGARFVEIVREKEDGKSMKFVNLATVGPVFSLVQVYMHPKSNGHTLDIFKLAKKHQGLRVSGVHVNHPKTRVDPLFVRVCRRYARPYSLATSPTILSGTRVANSSSRSGADMVVEELHSSRMSEELT